MVGTNLTRALVPSLEGPVRVMDDVTAQAMNRMLAVREQVVVSFTIPGPECRARCVEWVYAGDSRNSFLAFGIPRPLLQTSPPSQVRNRKDRSTMSVLQERQLRNDPSAGLRAKIDPFGLVEQGHTDSSSRLREGGLSFRNDFTREHSLPGTQFNF